MLSSHFLYELAREEDYFVAARLYLRLLVSISNPYSLATNNVQLPVASLGYKCLNVRVTDYVTLRHVLMLLFLLLPRKVCRGCFWHVEGQMSLIGEQISR